MNGGSIHTIGGSGITGYQPIFNLCIFGPCSNTTPSGVYVATGKTVKRYLVTNGVFDKDIYAWDEALGVVREIQVRNGLIFLLEDRPIGPASLSSPTSRSSFARPAMAPAPTPCSTPRPVLVSVA